MCTQCGNCCSRLLPLSHKDIKRIRHYIKKHDVLYERRRKSALDVSERNSCPFLLDNKTMERCSIYPARPTICREFDCKEKPHGKLGSKMLSLVDMYETFGLE